ncbi:MAG: TonB family protein, partial [Chitinophagales bacterium]
YYHYDTDKLSGQGKYKENEKEGKWESFDDKGRLKERLNYQAGLREGRFVQYDSLSNVINEGIYKADTIFEQTNNSETAENTLPILSSCATVNLEERQECFHKTLFKHLGRVVRYPSVAREYGVEGTAYVRFTINEDGTMSDIEVMSGLCASIAKECKRVIKTLPEWSPGLQNGKRVKVGYTLPFKFKLE